MKIFVVSTLEKTPIFDETVASFFEQVALPQLSDKSYRQELEEINRENPFQTGQI